MPPPKSARNPDSQYRANGLRNRRRTNHSSIMPVSVRRPPFRPAPGSSHWDRARFRPARHGSGPGGQKAAIAAAKLDKRVAIVERPEMLGGVCLNTGTIPSKTLREAVLYLTGLDQREMYGQSYRVKDDITIADLAARTQHVVSRENDVRPQPADPQPGRDPHRHRPASPAPTRVEVDRRRRPGRARSAPTRSSSPPAPARPGRHASTFDEQTIIDSDGILQLEKVPRSMVVVGAGVIGIEYASMFAALGTKVTVVEQRERMLEFCDVEVVEALKYHLRDLAVTFRFGETVSAVEAHAGGRHRHCWPAASGSRPTPSCTPPGRQGHDRRTDLARPGLTADKRGRIAVDEYFRTAVPHIYAVGDVIGFPALAATSMEQGRLAAHHACGEPVHAGAPAPADRHLHDPRDQLRRADRGRSSPGECIPFEVGVSRYRELARGPDHRRLLRRAQAAGLARRPASCSACTCSAPAPPSWCTSARP